MRRTIPTRVQSIWVCSWERSRIGEYFCCAIAAGMPKMKSATEAAMPASATTRGETPSIHIMVVVVSPTTLQAPPALEAATIAAR